ncbi:MAG: ribonuclease D [Pseudomonadota bacterium]
MPVPMNFDFITTQLALDDLLSDAAGSEEIALDTEFERVRTYHPRLCLIQLAFGTRVACIDALAELDLGAFWQFLADSTATKVMHAGRQDLELAHTESRRALGEPVMPVPYVDTQIAAGLLGIGEQVSYAHLVQERQQITLPKAHTRTDWTKRPLDPAQLDYAADDVRYLLPVWAQLREELRERGREHWVSEDSAALIDPDLYEVDTSEAWRRVKGARRLRPEALALLKRLADWRETRALERDKPRQWVLKDEVLLSLAQRRPDSLRTLQRNRDLPAAVVRRHGEELFALLCEPFAAHEVEPPRSYTPVDEPLVRKLMANLRSLAEQENVCATSIASRRDIEQFSRGHNHTRLERGWRREFVGEGLRSLREEFATL